MYQTGIEPAHTAPEAIALSTELLVLILYEAGYAPRHVLTACRIYIGTYLFF